MPGTDRCRRSPKLVPAGFLGAALWLGAALTLASCRRGAPAAAEGAGGSGGLSNPAMSPAAKPDLPNPTVVLEAGDRKVPFRVEVAATEVERERGLMFRKILTRPTGMLYVFADDAPRTVSMKNTLIPLDIIFIGHDRRILGVVENATPETETPRRVNGMSRYVLEIAGGLTSKLGVKPGSKVEFKGMPPGLFPDSGVGQPH
jgi:uncharacterized membrane protein (UPF0127 family)